MSRAARPPKNRDELMNMSLDQINGHIQYLRTREELAGTGVVAKTFRKRREVAERVRERQFGVTAKGRRGDAT